VHKEDQQAAAAAQFQFHGWWFIIQLNYSGWLQYQNTSNPTLTLSHIIVVTVTITVIVAVTVAAHGQAHAL
jgi:alkanesulfonate monooxygenase SsuD/methylene tetrahydromethanopterin reductase-like flavin-dependent oxidoreductase (luciferase family)